MPGNVRDGGPEGTHSPPHATPTRAMSLDSLQVKNTPNLDQKIQEYLPARTARAMPKINSQAMQFVKTGPATLYKKAHEQIKKSEEVKELRKTMVNEEQEWQENLDKWKSSRRKRLQTTVDSIIQIKKNEQEDEMARMRRKSKTFSQMQEDKNKRGRKYNLTIHDDDDNDLSSLGLTPSKPNGSITDTQDDQDTKDIDQDNKDAKSDAGFCTGSDTGSDGVFAEDNISDTSSALGDKKEAHDSLLDTGGSKDEEPHLNGHTPNLISEVFTSTSSTSTSSISHTAEYTYDKAIAGYKQYAENSAKKRTSSITSLNSNASHKEEDKKEKPRVNGRSVSPNKSSKMEEKVSFFSKEMERETSRLSSEPKVIMREKSPKVNISQRRSMFENVDVTKISNDQQQKINRRSLDISNSLKNKVASFENLEPEPIIKPRGTTFNKETNLKSKVSSFENLSVDNTKARGITPPRDANFHVKLAAFSSSDCDALQVKKTTPERDVNFRKKLASFNAFENDEIIREQKTVPVRDPSLKKKIASYEQLEQAAEETMKNKDRSMSLENLDEPEMEVKIRPSRSMMNITRRPPSTPYMEVEIENSKSEKECVVDAQPVVNAQVFEIASKLEETPIVDSPLSPISKVPSTPMEVPSPLEEDSLEVEKEYTDADINEVDESKIESVEEAVEEHEYQTLEEVRQEVVPPPPARTPPVEPQEVLDVTWTDGPSQAAPPSEPPPPPPPDDDSDSDVSSEQPHSLPVLEEDAFKRENSTRRLKKELWRRRSDFLGTSSQYNDEEQAVKPPPDLSDLLRQEREADRSLLCSKTAKATTQEMLSDLEIARREREIIENLERSEQLKQQQQQQQQMWDTQTEDSGTGELDDHFEYQQVNSSVTDFESDTGPKFAKVVPVTTTNNIDNLQSVCETTNLNVEMPHGFHHTHNTSEPAIERHVEVLDNTVANVPPESQFSETSGMAESHHTDHSLANNYTLDDSVTSSGSHPDEYKKLAELEEEMMRHDKDMLRRVGHLPEKTSPAPASSQSSSFPSPDSYDPQEGSYLPQPLDSSYKMQQRQPPSHLPLQEFYTAPTYDSNIPAEANNVMLAKENMKVGLPISSPSDYTTLASPHPFSRSNSHSSIDTKRHLPLQPNRSTPLASPRDSIPEPLPRKKKVVSPPVPNKNQRILPDLNTAERIEAMRVSRMTSNESLMSSGEPVEPQESSSALSGQQMSKQTLLALSAIPKPRLIENESWIKKKQEGQKRDYSKHWLHQEAEQRRLEQQDRISRPKYTPSLPPQQRSSHNSSPQFLPHQQQSSSHTQSYLPSQSPSHMFPPQNSTQTYSSYPQSLRSPSPSRKTTPAIVNNSNNINNNVTSPTTTTSIGNGSWRNQATTYQPHIPAPAANGDKALPDSIINNLTQRINNKNTKNTTYNAPTSRPGNSYSNNNHRDENYHDYMNADALSSASSQASPHFQTGQSSPPSTQQQQDTNSPQDQRLLSVSGKKKCSHCSEELGRGAAMIIESLRLFYHIPCFKCCVCGIQLGNGSAGADVRVRNHKLHCHNCYSNDEGMKFSKV